MDKSFFKDYPLNQDYSFNLNYEIRFKGIPQDKIDPETIITIDTHYGQVSLSVKDFSLLTHYEIDLPPVFYKLIKFVPSTSKLLRSLSGFKVVFTEKINHGCPDGYYRIPGYNNYAINESGDVINIYTKNSTSQFMVYGYMVTGVKGPTSASYTSLRIHVALAKVFIPNPEDKEIVNHKDGDKSNNELSNLEWVTPSENTQHALKLGLASNVRKCKLRDIETGEIYHFESISQAGKFIGYGSGLPYTLKYLQGKKTPLLFRRRYEFKYEEDKEPWFYTKGSKLKIDSVGPFEIRNVHDGELRRFDLLKDVAEFLRVNVGRVYTANLTNGERTLNGYQIRPVSEMDWPIPRQGLDNTAQVYTVYDMETKEFHEFTSSVKAAKFIGTDRVTLKRRALDGKAAAGKYLVFNLKKEEIGPVHTEPRLFRNDGEPLKPITLS